MTSELITQNQALAGRIREILARPHHSGHGRQLLVRFHNGYGASIVQFLYELDTAFFGFPPIPIGSYGAEDGLWELAPLVFEETAKIEEFELVDDVSGWLTPSDCMAEIERISLIAPGEWPKEDYE